MATTTHRAPRDRTRTTHLWTLFASAGAFVLCTVSNVLWYPINMGAIERADDAGWAESLLLPNQFLLTVVLLGAWLCSAAAVTLAARSFRADRQRVAALNESSRSDRSF